MVKPLPVEDVLVGFAVLVENLSRDHRKVSITERLRSVIRGAPEEIAYGNLMDFILYHYSKTGRKCFENVKNIRYGDLAPSAELPFDFRGCRDEEAAHGLLLTLVLEYLERSGYLPSPWGDLSTILGSLKNLEKSVLEIIEMSIVELLERAKRITEALVET